MLGDTTNSDLYKQITQLAGSSNLTDALDKLLPEVLGFEEFRKKKAVQNQVAVGLLPIGLDFEEVEPVCMDISQCKHVLLVSDKETSYVKLRKSILDGMIYLSKETKLILIDPEEVLEEYSNKVKTFITGEE